MRTGFSLVELAIVLVILGLLTGGILAGQSLIRAAGLRSVSTEYQRYVTAAQAFRDKYFYLPGDMPNAVSFWGAADGGTGSTAACTPFATTDGKTCNGNGDGMINAPTGPILVQEWLRTWQHLANAGLIEGRYTGANNTPAANQYVIGLNVPGSKLDSQSYWFPQYEMARTNIAATTRFIAPAQGNSLFFGGWNGTYSGNLSPEDAWNIDTKMDDGKPASGKMWAPPLNGYSSTSTNCTNAADAADRNASYLLSNPNKDCQAFFMNAL